MFEGLRDPDPPRPGLREYALVTGRTRELRRRRRLLTVPMAVMTAVFGVVAIAGFITGRPADRERLSAGEAHAPASLAEQWTTPSASLPRENGDRPSTVRVQPLETFDATALGAPLPPPPQPIDIEFLMKSQTLTLTLIDGLSRFCVEAADIERSCATPGASIHWLTVTDTEGRTGLVLFAHSDLNIAFELVDRTCTEQTVGTHVRGWICPDVAPSDTEVRIVGSDRILIDTVPSDAG